MEPGHTEEHGDQSDAPSGSQPVPPAQSHDSTQVLPIVTDDPAPSFTERSDAATGQLPPPPSLDATRQLPAQSDDFGPATEHTAQFEPVDDRRPDAPAGSGYEQPGYGQPPPPSYQQPGYQQPGYPEPTYPTTPGYQPGYQQPGYGQPQQPAYGQPSYDQPAYQQPAYPPAAYGQPSYDQPTYQQPAYQQPGYQPTNYQAPAAGFGPTATAEAATAGDTRRKSHKGLWSLLIVVIIIAAAVGVLFAVKPSPLFKKVLDSSAVEQTIENQSKNGLGDYTNVSCPPNEKVKSGTTFECTASGNKRISVTVQDSKGNYEWKPAS